MSEQASGGNTRILVKPGSAPYDWENGATRLRFAATNLAKRRRTVRFPTITGLRGTVAENVRESIGFTFGTIRLSVNPAEMQVIAPFLLGDNEAPAGTFTPDLQPQPFGVLIDRITSVFEYECYVHFARIQGRAPQFNEQGSPEMFFMELFVIALDENPDASWPVANPPLLTGLQAEAMVFQELAVTLAGQTRLINALNMTLHNHMDVAYVNSVTANSICSQDFSVNAAMRVPWNAETDADLFRAPYQNDPATIAFINSTVSTTMNFPNSRMIGAAPPIRGKTGLYMDHQWAGYLSGANNLMELINDDDAA